MNKNKRKRTKSERERIFLRRQNQMQVPKERKRRPINWKRWINRDSIIWGVTIVLIVTQCTQNRLIALKLRKGGVCTTAVVYDDGYRATRFYEFKVGKKYYRGSAYNYSLDIGDTLTIVYLPSVPKINKENEVVRLDCGCDDFE